MLHQLQGETLGQADAAEFAAGVGEVPVAARESGLGVDLHDVHEDIPAEAVLDLHHLAAVPGAEIEAPVIHFGDELEALRIQLREAARLQDSRVADQQIQAAVGQHGLPDHPGYGAFPAHIRHKGQTASGPESPVHLHGAFAGQGLIDIGDEHVGTLGEQALGDAGPETLGGTGHQGDPPRDRVRAAGVCVIPARPDAADPLAERLGLPIPDELDLVGREAAHSPKETAEDRHLHGIEEYRQGRVRSALRSPPGEHAELLHADDDRGRPVGTAVSPDPFLDQAVLLVEPLPPGDEQRLVVAVHDVIRSDGGGQPAESRSAFQEWSQLAAGVEGDDRAVGHQQHPDRRGQHRRPVRIGVHRPELRDPAGVPPQPAHQPVRGCADLLVALTGDAQAVVLEQQNRGIAPLLPAVQPDRLPGRPGQDMPRIHRGYPEHRVAQDPPGGTLALPAAGQRIDQGRMGMDHEGRFQQVVEAGLHAGMLGLLPGFPGRQEVFQHPGFPLLRILRVAPVPHGRQLVPAQAHEALFTDFGQRNAGGLDVQVRSVLVRAVTASPQDEPGVRTVMPGDRQQILQLLSVHPVGDYTNRGFAAQGVRLDPAPTRPA